jgi:hypothetical protein
MTESDYHTAISDLQNEWQDAIRKGPYNRQLTQQYAIRLANLCLTVLAHIHAEET